MNRSECPELRLADGFRSSMQRGSGDPAALEPLEPRLLLSGNLWITEFMAINRSTLQDGDGDYPDWIEIFNASTEQVDLEGYYLTDRANNLDMWRFPSVTLPPAGFLVVFASGKDRTDPAELHTNFSLRGAGEYLALVRPDGTTIEFEYAPMFPPQSADVSYGIIVPGEEHYFAMPSPGVWNTLSTTDGVVINEVLTHTDEPQVDAIELHNAGEVTVDLSGWYLSDRSDDYFLYRIPEGTLLAAGAYLVFDEHDFNIGESGFALSRFGEEVWLVAADADGNPTRLVDHVEFGPLLNGMTYGRYPDGHGEWTAMATNTLGYANSGPYVSSVVISEIHYHPGDTAGIPEADLVYIELHNHTDSDVTLDWFDARGSGVRDDREGGWALVSGVGYEFPEGTSISTGGHVLVVGFDPTDAAKLEAFRAFYSISTLTPGVDIVGPWDGSLPNSGGTVILAAADNRQEEDTMWPMVTMDQVRFGVTAPWPEAANGHGSSLHRVDPRSFGNCADSWIAAPPAPRAFGDGVLIPGDINGDGRVDLDDFVILKQNFGQWGVTRGEGDLNGDGVVDLDDFLILKQNFGASAAPASVDVVAEVRAATGDDSPDATALEETGNRATSLPRSSLRRWRRSGIGWDAAANAIVDLLAMPPQTLR